MLRDLTPGDLPVPQQKAEPAETGEVIITAPDGTSAATQDRSVLDAEAPTDMVRAESAPAPISARGDTR
jgi:hypothetical protein